MSHDNWLTPSAGTMMADHGNAGIVDAVRSALHVSRDSESVIFPTLLIRRPPGLATWASAGSRTSADLALGYFGTGGFEGDRTRLNTYGYPGLLRELGSPPPWVEIDPEDVEGMISAERQSEL